MKVQLVDKKTGLKYWFDTISRKVVPPPSQVAYMTGSSIFSNLFSKVASSGVVKKLGEKATKDMLKKGAQTAITKESEEIGTSVGKAVSGEINRVIRRTRKKPNKDELRRLIKSNSQNKLDMNVRSEMERML